MDRINQILEQFHKIASSPEAQMNFYLEQGKKVVACVPVYTPEELVHAMGMVPFGAWGADIEIKEAKQYFPAFICSIMQSILETGIAGGYKGISAIIVPSLCDSLKCLGQNWKYAVPDIPFIPMTYPQNRGDETGKAFTKAGYERVIKELCEITGKEFCMESLTESIRIYNEHNKIMRTLGHSLAEHPSVTAIERKDIFKSAYFMRKEEHTELVKQLLNALSERKEEGKKIGIITSGILCDNENLLEVFDKNGFQIVADDIAHESRQYRVDTDTAGCPVEALADKFARMDCCSVLYDADKKRADYLITMAKERGAKGIVVLMTKFCDPEEFDYVIIKKACETAGLPMVQIEVDRQMVNYEQAATAMQAFGEMLRGM